ncbi:MAG: hypothetical protein JW770_06555, partial [Actinobacteria bacterium]|nr:hypothetical protein [Actinomycetota bacterium]
TLKILFYVIKCCILISSIYIAFLYYIVLINAINGGGITVLIEVKNNITTFICGSCGRIITTAENFLINPMSLSKYEFVIFGGKYYYRCSCGERYELIKSSNPSVSEYLKFKMVRVVEQEYLF